MLDEKQTRDFLEWARKERPKELLRLLFAAKTATVDAFAERILESIAKTGDASMLRFLIECGLDVHHLAGLSGGKYLQVSLLSDWFDVAHLLLDYGADVNPPLGGFPYEYPPIYSAILAEEIELSIRLLEAGANVETKYVEDSTALSLAVMVGNTNLVCQLLQVGADVDSGEIWNYKTLDFAYLHRKNIYQLMLPRSRTGKTSLTMSGILSAANRGCRALSQYLDEEREQIYKNQCHQKTELEHALSAAIAEKQNFDVISLLLDFGVGPNTETVNTSPPPLLLAARSFDIVLAGRLLDAGARINSSDLLSDAAQFEEGFDILSFLIEQGADVTASGATALRSAICGNNLGGIKLLLKFGADINDAVYHDNGYSPLARAARSSEIRIIKYLVDNGATVNGPPNLIARVTPLQAAAAAGKLDVVRFLLDNGANDNANPSSLHGTTVLEASLGDTEFIITKEHEGIFQLLLDKGADINGPSARRRCKDWNSALVKLITKHSDYQLIQRALDSGANVNRHGQGKGARTPLQAAAEVGNFELVKQLLRKGAEVNAPASANYGRTALQAACSGDNPKLELVRYLLKEGAEVNAPAGIKRGLTAVQGAAIRGMVKIALVLLDAGAEVNAETAETEGRTALDGAAEHGRLDMVQILLNLGAKGEMLEDAKFGTAIKLARDNGHFAVGKLLEEAQANEILA
ncbi:hypothetical protein EG329_000686 [Mollisiaceae sp. DMI_Dod_QoI]|nr:hypothetical protein EG329_000686 [Helotiales sp. DMI_Dod_QoI]